MLTVNRHSHGGSLFLALHALFCLKEIIISFVFYFFFSMVVIMSIFNFGDPTLNRDLHKNTSSVYPIFYTGREAPGSGQIKESTTAKPK